MQQERSLLNVLKDSRLTTIPFSQTILAQAHLTQPPAALLSSSKSLHTNANMKVRRLNVTLQLQAQAALASHNNCRMDASSFMWFGEKSLNLPCISVFTCEMGIITLPSCSPYVCIMLLACHCIRQEASSQVIEKIHIQK